MSLQTFKDFFSRASDNFIEARRHDYLAQLQDLEWRREAIEARLDILNTIIKARAAKPHPEKAKQKVDDPVTGPMR
jgi:hypothetical protein